MDNSFWIETTNKTNYPKLEKDTKVDVCVVGGGIVSAITAYLLMNSGLNVCVLEKNRVCTGVTANTTAKITSQHDLFYNYLTNNFDLGFAKQYLNSNEEAISLIKSIIEKENIDCDFEMQDSYVFTTSKQEAEKIKTEIDVVNKLGLNAEYLTKIPLPVKDIVAAVKFPNQAQFHARKYVLKLFDIVSKNGVKIYENSKVTEIKHNSDNYTISTDLATVTAKYVVIATHYPIKNFPGFYFLKMYQSKSYAIAVDTKEELFPGMYINSWDPVISFRTVPYNNSRLLIVVGSDHKTGATDVNIEDSFKNLENYIRNIYPNMEVKYRWSTEDCITLDKVPYIGEFSNLYNNMYIATGFKKWGMTLSHVAGKIIADKILGKESEYSKIYTATRLQPIKNIKEFGNMLKQSTYSLVINKTKAPLNSLDDITNGNGGIIEYNSKKIGVYKDDSGKIYAVKPICKHLGCELSWNNLEKTWDCPCHGSRYDYMGNIITEPTKENLDIVEL